MGTKVTPPLTSNLFPSTDNMSWQAYVDDQMVASGHISRGAILGLEAGGSVWAKSPGFDITDQEVKDLVKAASENPESLFGTGVHLAGKKYMTIRAEDGFVAGKKGQEGMAAYKSGKTLVVGEYPEGVPPPKANGIVEYVANYLKDNGF